MISQVAISILNLELFKIFLKLTRNDRHLDRIFFIILATNILKVHKILNTNKRFEIVDIEIHN